MPQVNYPLDTTGLSPANKVVDEPHVLTEINAATYRILLPDFAPFYQDNFVLKHVDTLGVETIMARDVDFAFTLPYLSASRAIGKMVWGAVTIINALVDGSLRMTYQTLGGDEIADVQLVREKLAEVAYNPRIASWDVIANKPTQFPPVPHDHSTDQFVDMEDMVNAINNVADAVLAGPNPSNDVVHHFTDTDNPHVVTKEQVGLGNVQNLEPATDAEVMAHEPLDKTVTLRQILMLMGL